MEKLTPAEIHLLDMFVLGGGPPDKRLAAMLGIESATVKAHFKNIRRKLGLRHRTSVALFWAKRKFYGEDCKAGVDVSCGQAQQDIA